MSDLRVEYRPINGVLTRFYRAGSGPALVLIHPVGYPPDCFIRNFAGLAKSRTVIAPDLLGQGMTVAPRPWPAPPQVAMADHVIALMDDLEITKASLLGSSLGGLIAALVALRRPERTENLIVVGSGSVFNPPEGQPPILRQVQTNGTLALREPTWENCRKRIGNTCFRPVDAPELLALQMTVYARHGALDDYNSIMEGLIASVTDPNATVYPHLELIRTRTLVIVGDRDVRTSYQSHADGAKRMPDAQVVRIPECGHLPFLEDPDNFNDLVTRFLAGETVREAAA